MNQWYKNKIFLGVLIILVVGGFFAFRGSDKGSESLNEDNDIVEVREGEISVTGEITCLTYRSATPGQSCVKALKGDDGKMYALNSTGVGGAELAMPEGTKVTAVGVFEVADTSVDDSSVFRYDGVLVLSSLKKR